MWVEGVSQPNRFQDRRLAVTVSSGRGVVDPAVVALDLGTGVSGFLRRRQRRWCRSGAGVTSAWIEVPFFSFFFSNVTSFYSNDL